MTFSEWLRDFMRTSKQLSLGPMPLQEVGSTLPTSAKKVGNVPMVDQFVRAFIRHDRTNQQAAGELGLSASDYSKAFSKNWPDRNGLMKKFDDLDFEVRREFVALMAADYGITSQQDSEPVRVLRDLGRLLRAVGE